MAVPRETLSEQIADMATHHDRTEDLAAGIGINGSSFTRDFVLTDELDHLAGRALRYLDARIPVHFRGRAGGGKTALALYLAHELGRSVHFINGDAMRDTASLVGQESGMRTREVFDRYIHSVHKTERETTINWRANALTQAALGGGTLIYDEFTRSPAEANNTLLSVLEEGILVLPAAANGGSYAPVHSDFRVIFTSNSLEYAGVQAPQDALLDRMITFDLDDLSAETETAIVAHRAGISSPDAAQIVSLVRAFRQHGDYSQFPTMRACLMIAQVAKRSGLEVSVRDSDFFDLVLDVLLSKSHDASPDPQAQRGLLFELLNQHCPSRAVKSPASVTSANTTAHQGMGG